MGLIAENRFLIFWSILGAAGFVLIWNLPWRFQVNDDEVMMWLVSGAYTGSPEWFAVFLHPALSWFFSRLYYLFPIVPWYPLAWYLILYTSFLVFVNLVRKNTQFKEFKNLWILFFFAFLVHFLFFLQFSIVSAVAVTVGFAARLTRKRSSLFSVFPEDVLILIGFLVRPDVLMLFLAGIVGYGALLGDKEVFKKVLVPAILWIFGMLFSWGCLEVAGLQEFQDINQLRSQVFDHPALQLHKEEIKDIESELYFFSNGLIDFQTDSGLSEKLTYWKDLLDQKRLGLISPKAIFLALSTYVQHEHFLLGWMVLFVAFAFFWNWKKSRLLFLIILGVLIISSPFYLIKVQIYGILILFFFLTVFLTDQSEQRGGIFKWSFSLILSMALGFHFYSFFQSQTNRISAEQLSAEMNLLKGNEQIYLVGKGEYYRDLLFDQPLRFKILGWPTLLENQLGIQKANKSIYFVDSASYFSNLEYFENYVRKDSQTSLILLIEK